MVGRQTDRSYFEFELSNEAAGKLKAAWLAVKHFLQYGVFNSSMQALNKIKKWIREGRVIWLHAVIKPVSYTRPTWFTQLCRAAHRVGAHWTFHFTAKPWDVKPFETLRRHKYVTVWTPEDSSTSTHLGSEAVDLERLHGGALAELIVSKRSCRAQLSGTQPGSTSERSRTKRQLRDYDPRTSRFQKCHEPPDSALGYGFKCSDWYQSRRSTERILKP